MPYALQPLTQRGSFQAETSFDRKDGKRINTQVSTRINISLNPSTHLYLAFRKEKGLILRFISDVKQEYFGASFINVDIEARIRIPECCSAFVFFYLHVKSEQLQIKNDKGGTNITNIYIIKLFVESDSDDWCCPV